MHIVTKALLILAVISILALLIPRIVAILYANPRTYTQEQSPTKRVAIVLGAGLQRDGTPSPVLRDRVATAVELYNSGKVEKLLMSGDNRFLDYNEPGSMREYAIGLGVPEDDIVLDYAGRRTYDTCYRARSIFQVDEAILVTQAFHLPRALMICNGLGLPSVGVTADQRPYRGNFYWSIREFPATSMAAWEILVTRPLPVLGDPEPIFPDQTGIQGGQFSPPGS